MVQFALMKYKITNLPNGVRLLTVPFPNMESATITVWVNTGSRYETGKISGLSHFLEHMVFKGSSKRPSAKEISEVIDSFGGEFNAATSKDWTNFYIKSRSEKLPLAMDVLSDMVLNPILNEKEMEKEKGVIIEEIGMYEDTPMMHIGDVFENLIFGDTPLGWDVIGSRETVAGMKRENFVDYRARHYGSNSIVITISGGFDEKEIIKLCTEHFGGLKSTASTEYKKFASKQEKPQILVSPQKKEQAHFIIGFRGNPRGHKDRHIEAVLSTILGGGMSSRLFTEVREKRGLAYSVNSGHTHYDDTGYQEMYAGVDPKRVEEALKVSLDQYYGLTSGEYKISSKELTKAKEYIKGHLALNLENTKNVNYYFGLRLLKLGDVETPEDVYKGVDAVSVDDILRVAKELFVPEKLNFAIIGPYDDKTIFEKVVNS